MRTFPISYLVALTTGLLWCLAQDVPGNFATKPRRAAAKALEKAPNAPALQDKRSGQSTPATGELADPTTGEAPATEGLTNSQRPVRTVSRIETFGSVLEEGVPPGHATLDYGFCPEDQDSVDSVPRPNLSNLLAVRAAVLMEQVRHTYHQEIGSPQLRRALAALFSGHEEAAIAALAMAPDRIQNGFDYAANAALVLGTQALTQGALAQATRYRELAAGLSPRDPLVHVLGALLAEKDHSPIKVEAALRRAHKLAPNEPAVALTLGQHLAETAELDDAIRALSVYLNDAPIDRPIGQLRERLRTQRQLHQGLRRFSHAGVTLLWPESKLDEAQASAILEELVDTLGEAATLLEQQRREALLVVIYRERSELLASTCVPQWTDGVFDGVLRLHAASVTDAQRRRSILRHEVLHAQLRSVPIHAPHWFHEGVAQYFAEEEGPSHLASYRLMVEHDTYVPFASLEGSFLVISADQDVNLAYHQSLAMVQMLVKQRGPSALADAVRYLRTEPQPAELWQHMLGTASDGPALLAHLTRKLTQVP